MEKLMKITGVFILTAALIFALVACDSEEDDTAIIGKWYETQEMANLGVNGTHTFEFKKDGKYKPFGGLVEYDYEAKGGVIKLKTGILPIGNTTYSIKGTELTIDKDILVALLLKDTYYKPSN